MSLIFVFLIFGFVALAAGWTLAGFWPIGLALLCLIPLSLFLVKRKFPPALSLALALTVLAAAIGLWRGLDFSLALIATLCALAAWDLDRFSRWLEQVPAEDQPRQLERQHLFGLGLVIILGVGLTLLARFIPFQASFEWAALLAVLAFGGLGFWLSWLRKRE